MKMKTPDRKLMESASQYINAKESAGRQAQRAYMREWRANNRDKVRQYNQDYWARRAERERAV